MRITIISAVTRIPTDPSCEDGPTVTGFALIHYKKKNKQTKQNKNITELTFRLDEKHSDENTRNISVFTFQGKK